MNYGNHGYSSKKINSRHCGALFAQEHKKPALIATVGGTYAIENLIQCIVADGGFGNSTIWDVCSVGAVVGVVKVVVDSKPLLQNRFGTRRARNTTM